jgi:hypothetical protein
MESLCHQPKMNFASASFENSLGHLTCPQQVYQFLSYSGVQVKPGIPGNRHDGRRCWWSISSQTVEKGLNSVDFPPMKKLLPKVISAIKLI